jgi:hypothetical protein
LDGWTPSIPEGESFELETKEYKATEKLGIKQLGSTGFVLVAGGLGERLGYNGAKVRRPALIRGIGLIFAYYLLVAHFFILPIRIQDWIAHGIYHWHFVHPILLRVHLSCSEKMCWQEAIATLHHGFERHQEAYLQVAEGQQMLWFEETSNLHCPTGCRSTRSFRQ